MPSIGFLWKSLQCHCNLFDGLKTNAFGLATKNQNIGTKTCEPASNIAVNQSVGESRKQTVTLNPR